MPTSLIPAQIRGARGMLGWSMLDLARASGVSVSTVKRMELAAYQTPSAEIQAAVLQAFNRAGVTFLGDDMRSVGVMLRFT